MNHKNHAILIQTAFKGATELSRTGATADSVLELTGALYDGLLGLALSRGIDMNADFPVRSPNKAKPAGGGFLSDTVRPSSDAPTIEIGGQTWNDYRGLKQIGAVNPNFPDFKLGTKGEWLIGKDGQPTQFALSNNLA